MTCMEVQGDTGRCGCAHILHHFKALGNLAPRVNEILVGALVLASQLAVLNEERYPLLLPRVGDTRQPLLERHQVACTRRGGRRGLEPSKQLVCDRRGL